MFFEHSKKHNTPILASRPIMSVGKYVKATMDWGKMLTKCEEYKGSSTTWHALQIKGIWMDVHHGWKEKL